MTAPRAIVLSGLGINCERERAAALTCAGARTKVLHINAFLQCPTSSLAGASLVVFPGGFSFGDRLGAGQALANRIRHRRIADGLTAHAHLVRFVSSGGFLLGICNGFQVLAKLGLVPNTHGEHVQEVALAQNASGRFENRWCHLQVAASGPAGLFSAGDQLELPVRHGEGRIVFRDSAVRTAVLDQSLNWLTYVSSHGAPTQTFPDNPNGSDLSCAGLSDRTGRVLGLMPHPEAFVTPYMHYNWPRRRRESERLEIEADGLRLFRAVLHRIPQDGASTLDGSKGIA